MTEAGKKNTVLNILRSQRGFSLSELLVTLVLVGLITTAIAGGIAMVARSYTKVVDRADAEQLLSTTVSRITDELSFAEPYDARNDVNWPNNKTVEFVSGLTGMKVRITANGTTAGTTEGGAESGTEGGAEGSTEGTAADDSIHMYYYVRDAAPKEIPLYDNKLKDRMTVTYKTITYNNGLFTIEKLGVTLKGKTDPIVMIDSYTVARINGRAQS